MQYAITGCLSSYLTLLATPGALATLCAHELASRQPQATNSNSSRSSSGSSPPSPGLPKFVGPVAMYTFGQPRVGNVAFSEQFAQRVPASWRFYNRSDIVPTVPRLMGYKHVPAGEVSAATHHDDDQAAKLNNLAVFSTFFHLREESGVHS